MSFETTKITITADGDDAWKLMSLIKGAGLRVEAVVSTPGKKTVEVSEKPVKVLTNFNKTDKPKTRSKRKKWLTTTTKRELRKLAKEGKNMKEASVLTGIPYLSIYQWQKNPKSKVTFVKGKKGRKSAQ